ncbi:hypothetical protein GCM10010387_50500 [Streptomyces inusitatus]|uniref:Uncharacterized protein n=2 Tax=Streptomyces inusitatus TaxID=68221 RepID=A0A918QHD3_9ACTN|nr:hypothetical protein GCM10010387_50500 [Streptomyces inusitatus]
MVEGAVQVPFFHPGWAHSRHSMNTTGVPGVTASGGTVGLDHWNVHERAAQLTTSVVYDRAGTGWSSAVGLPRSSAEVTDELCQLLRQECGTAGKL